MTFSQALSNAIGVYYHLFDGRASRSEYWWPALPLFAGYVVMMAMMLAIAPDVGSEEEFVAQATGGFALIMLVFFIVWLYGMVMMIPLMVLTGRRLHDTDKSVWWVLISLIPLIGPIVLLVFMVQRGTNGPNRFGPDPLGRGGDDGGGIPYRGEGLTSSSIPSIPRD